MVLLKSGKPKGYYSKAQKAMRSRNRKRQTGRHIRFDDEGRKIVVRRKRSSPKHTRFDDNGSPIRRKYVKSGKYSGVYAARRRKAAFGPFSNTML